MSEDQGWRLKAELDAADTRGALDRLLGRLRGPDVVHEVGAAVGHDVVVTHDGRLLFVYAATEPALTAARGAIEVAFTVTGPKRKIDEFAAGLKAEEAATMRAERAVMLSPL